MGMLFNSFSSFITLASNITCSLNKTEQSQSESSSNYQMMGLSQGGMFGSGNQNCASICGGQGGYPQPLIVPQVQPMVCNCSPGGAGPFPFIPGVNPFGPNVNPYNPLQPVGPNYTTSVVKPEPSTSCSYALYSQCETVLPDEKTITQSVPSVLPPNVQPTIPVGPYGGFGGSSVCISSCALPQVLPKPVIVNPYLPNQPQNGAFPLMPTNGIPSGGASPRPSNIPGSVQQNCVCDIPQGTTPNSNGSGSMILSPQENSCVAKRSNNAYEDCLTTGVPTQTVSGIELPTFGQAQGMTCTC